MAASMFAVSGLPLLAAPRAQRAGARRASVRVSAAVQSPPPPAKPKAELSEAQKAAKAIGMDAEEGFFGFKPFPELWVGRFAMIGFGSGVANEILTGTPILQQIGLETPNGGLTTLLSIAIFGSTLAASVKTLQRIQSGNMTPLEAKRYGGFLGFMIPSAAAREGDMSGQASLKGTEAGAAGEAAPAEGDGMPSPVWVSEREMQDFEAAYARQVELTNGRWAMIGFASAILIESATGAGIIPQMTFYAKLTGLLGPNSGF